MARSCRHCGRIRAVKARGLCWRCYYTPAVSTLYPSQSKFCPRWNFNGAGASPEPTRAIPGSEDKILVLMERVDKRQCLWHPRDARMDSQLLN